MTQTSRVTVVEVAKRAGVATATAARALGEYGSVSASTRERVLKAAEELGYRANSIAKAMITGRSQSIGLIIADIENPFFSRLTRGVSDVVREAGFELMLVNTDEDPGHEAMAAQMLARKQVDGLIVAPASAPRSEHLTELQHSGVKIVLVDRTIEGFPADTVTVRNSESVREATAHLIELGHRRIGYVSGAQLQAATGRLDTTTQISTGRERIAGYREALDDAGIPYDSELLRFAGRQRADVVRETRNLLDLRNPPTAILTADSLLALGVLEELTSRGLAIPDDLSVISFDDSDWAQVLHPPLSVIAQPAYKLGASAARLLLKRIDGDSSPPRELKLDAKFIERASTAAVPQASLSSSGIG